MFNFSNEQAITVLELVSQILSVMDSNAQPLVLNEGQHEIRKQHSSASKARELLGWRPLFTLEQGLQRTIEWYRNFLGQTSCTTFHLPADLAAKSA